MRIIENLKTYFSNHGSLVQPTTSEIVRLALHVLVTTEEQTLINAAETLEDRPVGRPKE
jgi:hypothetical protein